MCSSFFSFRISDRNRKTWGQEIQPFAEESVLQNRTGGCAVKLRLAAIKFGTIGDLLCRYMVGFEIDHRRFLL